MVWDGDIRANAHPRPRCCASGLRAHMYCARHFRGCWGGAGTLRRAALIETYTCPSWGVDELLVSELGVCTPNVYDLSIARSKSMTNYFRVPDTSNLNSKT
jgi:hypothetical protein